MHTTMTNVRQEGTPQNQNPEQPDTHHTGNSGQEQDPPNSPDERHDPTNTSQAENFTPNEASVGPRQDSRRSFLKLAVAAALVAGGGVVAYKATRTTSSKAPTPATPAATATPSSTPSATAKSATPTTEPSPTPTHAETKSPSESLKALDAMSPEEFFDLPKSEQMLFFGAALQAAQRDPGVFLNTNKGIDDPDQLIYHNPIGGGEYFPDAKPASKNSSDQDILDYDRFVNQLIYRGIKLGSDELDFTKAYDAATANKLVALLLYYPQGSGFRNAVKNSEARARETFTGTSTAHDTKSPNVYNTDRHGKKILTRRVAYTEHTEDANGDPLTVEGVRMYALVKGTLPNGEKFQTWIRHNV